MNVVRQLPSNTPYQVIKEIYQKGNKIAVSYGELTILGDIHSIGVYDSSGEMKKGLPKNNGATVIDDSQLKENFTFTGDGLCAKANCKPFLVDDVYADYSGAYGTVHPYKGSMKSYSLDIYLYDDNGSLGAKVYEVSGARSAK